MKRDDLDQVAERITKLFNEDSGYLEEQLKLASLQLLLIEYMKAWLLSSLQSFLNEGVEFPRNKPIKYLIPDKYSHFFSGKKSFKNQLCWFQQFDVITDEQVEFLLSSYKRRNEVGHELFNLLMEHERTPILWEECKAIVSLLYKLDNWWWVEIEVATGAIDDRPEVTYEDVKNSCSVETQTLINFVERLKPKGGL